MLNAGERLGANEELWIVARGLTRVTGSGGGHSTVSWLCSIGQFFGSLDTLARRRHALEALALVPTELVRMPQAAFERFAADKPQVLRAALRALADRLQEEREMRAAMSLPSSERMLATLLALYRRLGHRIPMTRAAIAEMTGLARETSIRSLSPYEKQGLIRTRRGVIDILRPADLQNALDRGRGAL